MTTTSSASRSFANRTLVLALVCLWGCGRSAGPRLPLPVEVIEYAIPWADAFPSDLVVDDAGRVWFTDRLTHAVGRLDPETGAFERIPTPRAKSAPYGMVRGPDGAIWFAESRAGQLGRVDPATGAITEVPLGKELDGGPHLLAVEVGRIWFTMRGSQAYGSYDPSTGAVEIYPVPERMAPYGIAAGGGVVWVGGYSGTTVLEIDVRTDSVRLHDLGRPDPRRTQWLAQLPDSVRARMSPRAGMRGAGLRRMSVGADGRVWMTDFSGGRVLALARDDSLSSFESLDRRSEPYGILVASSGIVWYNEKRNDVIVALNPRTGERVRYRLPTPGAAVRHIAEDARRGRIWLPMSDRGRIGLIRLRDDALPARQGVSMR